jgi:hypothetical protein
MNIRTHRRASLTVTIIGLGLALASAFSFGAAHVARADGGTGETCSLSNVSVTVQSQQNLYAYEADCPGKPLGYFGGAVTAKYQVIGNWNWQTNTAHDNVFSFDRNQGEFDTWICTADPWTTPAQDANNNIPNGHTCLLQSQQGGSDWETDTGASFSDVMCFNDPWGASLAGCWGSDDLSSMGPSASILNAWLVAKAGEAKAAPQAQTVTPGGANLIPVHAPSPVQEAGIASLTPTATPAPIAIHLPLR